MKDLLKNLIQKLTSRKFIVCATVVGLGIAISSGVTSEEISEIVALITTTIGALAYIFSEASVDKASLRAREAEAYAEAAKCSLKVEEIKAGVVTK